MRFVGIWTLVSLLVMACGNALAGYLKDWRETRIVVKVPESVATKLGVTRDLLDAQARDLLAQIDVGPKVTGKSHGYLYVRLMADTVPGGKYFGVLDVRVVRPVVVIPIGKVAVAAVWEEAATLSGPVADFATDLRGALRAALAKLKGDWRVDNASRSLQPAQQ